LKQNLQNISQACVFGNGRSFVAAAEHDLVRMSQLRIASSERDGLEQAELQAPVFAETGRLSTRVPKKWANDGP